MLGTTARSFDVNVILNGNTLIKWNSETDIYIVNDLQIGCVCGTLKILRIEKLNINIGKTNMNMEHTGLHLIPEQT